METVVVLARIGGGALAALIGSAAFVLIMAFLLLGGNPKKGRQQ
ncbi:MAG TPA: hypothetical protein VJS45_04115 [Acidimicrobiia bacterium]|nr:hypothetical protein [Acidimicrobiia bacterium]